MLLDQRWSSREQKWELDWFLIWGGFPPPRVWNVFSVGSHSQGNPAYKHKSSLACVCVWVLYCSVGCSFMCVRASTFLYISGPWLNEVWVVIYVCVFRLLQLLTDAYTVYNTALRDGCFRMALWMCEFTLNESVCCSFHTFIVCILKVYSSNGKLL